MYHQFFASPLLGNGLCWGQPQSARHKRKRAEASFSQRVSNELKQRWLARVNFLSIFTTHGAESPPTKAVTFHADQQSQYICVHNLKTKQFNCHIGEQNCAHLFNV